MSGVQGQVLGHLVRRGFNAAQENFRANQQMEQLQKDAELYENSGPDMEIKPQQMIPVVITFLIMMLLLGSIRYTVGEVISSLTMIESRTTTAIIEDKPPAYTDEPDAPLEKETAKPSETEVDVEITLIPNKPITNKITTTVGHITRIGGFRARWRGAGLSVLYHFAHSMVANFFAHMLGFGLLGHSITYIFASVALSRLHMAWTHAMIAHPSSKPFWRRMVARKQCKPILLPALVFAAAQQATLLLPLGVAVALRVTPSQLHEDDFVKFAYTIHRPLLVLFGLRILAVVATAIFVALAVLLPAAVTLTRIEALLLPEGEETIVPFDRLAVVGDIDLTVRGGSRKLFLQAWRSFDRTARWRLIKLYMKLMLIQFTVLVAGLHIMVAEIYVIGGERLAIFLKSAHAQLKLALIEAYEQRHPN